MPQIRFSVVVASGVANSSTMEVEEEEDTEEEMDEEAEDEEGDVEKTLNGRPATPVDPGSPMRPDDLKNPPRPPGATMSPPMGRRSRSI